MLAVLAVLSLLVGNLAAIAQSNIKRMLAYSAIAQIGFMLLALTAGVVSGNTLSAGNAYSSALFYMLIYVLTTLGSFGVILLLARRGFECEDIADLAGLNARSPWMAGVMALCMFSLAGIPPTAGFFAKLSVLQALITTNRPHHLWLAVFAVMISLVAAYYYLRVVKLMYFDEPTADAAAPSEASPGAQALLAVNGGALLLLGLFPGALTLLCSTAILRALAS
jgi:NADH-quinone oxidoreductase subunit N